MSQYSRLNARDKKTVQRIIKVNHAGEYGAIRIYRAQLWMARRRYPQMVDFLQETLDHEIEHCRLFNLAMVQRQTRPCRVMSLWGNGGYVLGFITAILGPRSIWICTSAVEGEVHRHLEDQLGFLDGRDDDLAKLIRSIQTEELHHLNYANSKILRKNFWSRLLTGFISLATQVAIWLSTWGEFGENDR